MFLLIWRRQNNEQTKWQQNNWQLDSPNSDSRTDSANDPSAALHRLLRTLCPIQSSTVTVSLHLNLSWKLACSTLYIGSSWPVQPVPLKLRHYGALHMVYYYYCCCIIGCRSTPFVWYAVQTTSEIVTHWPVRCPSVAVFNCWRPSFRCGWCSTMEQSATWHRREWHTATFPSWTQNIFI